jgi:hypothetical protein
MNKRTIPKITFNLKQNKMMKTQLNTTIMALLLTAISTTVTATDTVATTSKTTTSTAPIVAIATNLKEVVTKDFSVADIKKDSKKAVKTAVLTPKTTTETTDPKAEAETATTATTKVTDTKATIATATATKTKVTDPKVTKIKLTAPVIVTVPTEATAKLATGYVGVGVGKSNLDLGITDLVNTTFDENHHGVKVLLGFNVDEHLSIEGYFAHLGGGTISGKNGNTFDVNGKTYTFDVNSTDTDAVASVDVSTINYGISGVYNFINIYDVANTNKITPFVKIGLHKWETKFNSDYINFDIDALETESGTDAFYGLGVSAEITDGIRAKLEFERFGMNKDTDYVSLVIVSDY